MDSLIRYAFTTLGSPYRWGGDDPTGWDCSGLVQEILQSVGIDPPGDQTAHMLYRYFLAHGHKVNQLAAGALVFYGSESRITHVAFCIDTFRVLEAGGGNSTTQTPTDAARQNAYVRVRPARQRRDLVSIIMPKYPRGMRE